MPVELRWDGKYNPDGTRRAPLRVALPFQTVETVNETAQERQRMLDLINVGRAALAAPERRTLAAARGRRGAIALVTLGQSARLR